MFLLFYIYIYYLIEGNLLITEVANEPNILTDQKELVPKDFTSIVEKFGPSFGTDDFKIFKFECLRISNHWPNRPQIFI